VWPPNLRVDFAPTDAATPGVSGRGRFRTNSLGAIRTWCAHQRCFSPRAEYFYDDMHLSEAGARQLAELVVAWILEVSSALPARP
jgi:hypothetical protein